MPGLNHVRVVAGVYCFQYVVVFWQGGPECFFSRRISGK